MAKKFRVFRAGPSRRHLLTVTFERSRLFLDGDSQLLNNLKNEGVDDPNSGKHFTFKTVLRGEDARMAFAALRERFRGDSVYRVVDN